MEDVSSASDANFRHLSQLSVRASAFSIDAIMGNCLRREDDHWAVETEIQPQDENSLEVSSLIASTPSPSRLSDSPGAKSQTTEARSPLSDSSLHHAMPISCSSPSLLSPFSSKMHPLAAVRCALDPKDLWERFHDLGTEMIITKSGRRMFPTLRVRFSGLESSLRYTVAMDIVPVDHKRYRYAYHRSSWVVAGKADPPKPYRLYFHPDLPFTGEQLMKQTVSFERLKLTNNPTERPGHIVLNSMHRYQPRVHVILISADSPCDLRFTSITQFNAKDVRTFTFPETVFTAVTAYQNQLITKLKIDSNPFAKGFRDSVKLTDLECKDGLLLSKSSSLFLASLPTKYKERFGSHHHHHHQQQHQQQLLLPLGSKTLSSFTLPTTYASSNEDIYAKEEETLNRVSDVSSSSSASILFGLSNYVPSSASPFLGHQVLYQDYIPFAAGSQFLGLRKMLSALSAVSNGGISTTEIPDFETSTNNLHGIIDSTPLRDSNSQSGLYKELYLLEAHGQL